MSIASAIQTAQGRVAAAYTACNSKGATMPATANQNLSNLATTIETISTGGGGGSVESKDVDFIDYDGTIVYSYTAAEFAALTALPANPSHTGLTAQGWNWSLNNAKTHVTASKKLIIGQLYVTNDGKTRLYINIVDTARMAVPLYWNQSVANGVTIDWGDGSSAETFSGTGSINTTHTYSAVGDYVITLSVSSGTLMLGSNDSSSISSQGVLGRQSAYTRMLQKVEIGSSISSITNYAFYNCRSLKEITLPITVTNFYTGVFYYCYSLKSITIPSSVRYLNRDCFGYCTSLSSVSIPASVRQLKEYAFEHCSALHLLTIPYSDSSVSVDNYCFSYCYALSSITMPSKLMSLKIEQYTFYDCYSLASITFPSTTTAINTNAFYECYSLASITIPSSVTSIGSQAFRYCSSLKSVYVLPETPPTLGSSGFTDVASDLVIYVPNGKLNDYQTASNWSTYASKMVEMPA